MISPAKEVLLPNGDRGDHKLLGAELIGRTIDIGKSDSYDSISDSRLIDCQIRIFRGAGLSFPRCTLDACTIEANKELKNVRFTGANLRNCLFLGNYVGCRFGNELESEKFEVVGCDFSQAKLVDCCEFLEGTDVRSLTLPAWPHITVLNIPQNRERWLALHLPKELRILQELIGSGDSWINAVTLYLPKHYAKYDDLRGLVESLDYVK